MKILSEEIYINTQGKNDIINLSESLDRIINKTQIVNGLITISVVGSTAGITTIEYEPGLLKDLPEMLENIVPTNKRYYHDNTWNDGNGYAHIRSSLIGTSISLPIGNGKLETGTWQQVVLIDFDNRPRKRKLIVKMIGE